MKTATLLLALLLTGCTSFKYRDIEIKSFLNKKGWKNASLTETSPDGTKRTIKIDGYSSDQTEALNAVIAVSKATEALAK